ncbi:MAG: hypothetical protein GYA16_14635 [Spirochaetes bacterium]|nr:hypothetical protein [Spirochaetota bacterium]
MSDEIYVIVREPEYGYTESFYKVSSMEEADRVAKLLRKYDRWDISIEVRKRNFILDLLDEYEKTGNILYHSRVVEISPHGKSYCQCPWPHTDDFNLENIGKVDKESKVFLFWAKDFADAKVKSQEILDKYLKGEL